MEKIEAEGLPGIKIAHYKEYLEPRFFNRGPFLVIANPIVQGIEKTYEYDIQSVEALNAFIRNLSGDISEYDIYLIQQLRGYDESYVATVMHRDDATVIELIKESGINDITELSTQGVDKRRVQEAIFMGDELYAVHANTTVDRQLLDEIHRITPLQGYYEITNALAGDRPGIHITDFQEGEQMTFPVESYVHNVPLEDRIRALSYKNKDTAIINSRDYETGEKKPQLLAGKAKVDVLRLHKLEQEAKDAVCIVVQNGDKEEVHAGLVSPKARLVTASEYHKKGELDDHEFYLRFNPGDIINLIQDHLAYRPQEYMQASPSGRGDASGHIAFDQTQVKELISQDKRVIYVKKSFEPEDMSVIKDIDGLVVTDAGILSHQSIVINNLGLTAIIGVQGTEWSKAGVQIQDERLSYGEPLSIEGSTGRLYHELIPLVASESDLSQYFKIAHERSPLLLRGTADTLKNYSRLNRVGIQDIGLFRTEHQLLMDSEARTLYIKLLEGDTTCYNRFIELLEEQYQKIYEESQKTRIRLFDLPIRELISGNEAHPLRRYDQDRGVRIMKHRPQIYKAQLEAINNTAPSGSEILIPFVNKGQEIRQVRSQLRKDITLGSMIETPFACYNIQPLTVESDFITFGFNDLSHYFYAIPREKQSESKIDSEFFNLVSATTESVMEVAPDIDLSACINKQMRFKDMQRLQNCGIHALNLSYHNLIYALTHMR